MKICYVANSRFPSERAHMTQIVQMCNAFVSCGHEVTLLVTDRKTDIAEQPEIFFGIPILFRVVRIKTLDIAGRALSIPKFLQPILYTIQRGIFSYNASRYINTHIPDLVYGRDEWVLWIIRVCIAGKKIVWESHEARYSFAGRKLTKAHCPLVVISEGIRDFYMRQGIEGMKILVAHDAVDDRFFEPHVTQSEARRVLGIETTKPVVMYIGGLETWKGGETLFEASTNQDAFETYVIGGKDRELGQFRIEYPQVHFLGPRPYKELPVLQQAADVLVIPNTAKETVSATYTSPLKLFAYMTSKKPIVASRIPSITNILNDTEAYFFTPDDPASLRGTINTVLNDPEGGRRRAHCSYEKSRECTWSKRADEIIQFIQ